MTFKKWGYIIIENKGYEEKSSYEDVYREFSGGARKLQIIVKQGLELHGGSYKVFIGDVMTYVHVIELEYILKLKGDMKLYLKSLR